MALVYCRECGAKISDKAVECPKCGAVQISTETILNDNVILESNSSNTRGASNAWIKWLIGGAIVGLLIFLGVVYYPKLFPQNNGNEMLLAEWDQELNDNNLLVGCNNNTGRTETLEESVEDSYPSYLEGVWFETHYATHKISFNSDMHFTEIDYDNKIIKGRYTINDSVIILNGDNGSHEKGTIKIIDGEFYIAGENGWGHWMVRGSEMEDEFENAVNEIDNSLNINKILEGY